MEEVKRNQPATLTDVVTSLSQVRTSIDSLAQSLSGLASRDEMQERADRMARRFWIAVIVIIVVLGYVAAMQLQLRSIASANHDNNHVLIECTTPDNPKAKTKSDRVHECYDNGLRNQAAAVQSIVDADHDGQVDTIQMQKELREIESRLGVTTTTQPSATK